MNEIVEVSNHLKQLTYAVNTFYILIMGGLVMWMAAGFSMLEAGLVRSKNTAEILSKNIVLYATACIMYLLVGFNIMYPGDNVLLSGVLPGFSFFVHETVSLEQALGTAPPRYPHLADFFFQVVFAATAMSVVSGAVAERMKLWAFFFFAIVMTGFIYPLQGYWKWGEGFLHDLGFMDFAGSGVVHLCGATAAFAGVLLLGPRLGKYGRNGEIFPIPGANLPLSTLGTLILWFGWFGFNGGSQLKITDVENANAVAQVIANTNMAACGGLVTAMIVSRLLFGKADLTMILNGALAGLVAITAEPATPSAHLAVLIGAVGGFLVVFSIITLDRMRIDDPVGAISVHGTCGMWGLLAVPLSNSEASFATQLTGLATIFGFVLIASLLIWMLLMLTIGIRVSPEEEYEGLDLGECGVEAYPEFAGTQK